MHCHEQPMPYQVQGSDLYFSWLWFSHHFLSSLCCSPVCSSLVLSLPRNTQVYLGVQQCQHYWEECSRKNFSRSYHYHWQYVSGHSVFSCGYGYTRLFFQQSYCHIYHTHINGQPLPLGYWRGRYARISQGEVGCQWIVDWVRVGLMFFFPSFAIETYWTLELYWNYIETSRNYVIFCSIYVFVCSTPLRVNEINLNHYWSIPIVGFSTGNHLPCKSPNIRHWKNKAMVSALEPPSWSIDSVLHSMINLFPLITRYTINTQLFQHAFL